MDKYKFIAESFDTQITHELECSWCWNETEISKEDPLDAAREAYDEGWRFMNDKGILCPNCLNNEEE